MNSQPKKMQTPAEYGSLTAPLRLTRSEGEALVEQALEHGDHVPFWGAPISVLGIDRERCRVCGVWRTKRPPPRNCPDCHVERADYEGPGGQWLPTCPNCGSESDPVEA